MVKRFLIVALLIGGGILPVAAAPNERDALTQFDRLPDLKTNAQAGGQSSYDRSGGNTDHNNFLYTDSFGDDVLLDLKSPGTLYRLWVTGFAPDARIKFYFDGEALPRVNLPMRDFFAGTLTPFVTPLVGNNRVSSGGFYSYVPMPFQRGLKITVRETGSLFFYNLGYHVYSSETPVVTWTLAQDITAARELWNRAGQDPKNTIGNVTSSGVVNVAAGATQTLLDIAGPRSISSIKLRVPGLSAEQPATDLLNNLWLQIYWDDEPRPSVFAPLGAFFAMGQFGFYPTRALAVGIDDAENLYVYFPMPFEKRARVQIVNSRAVAAQNIAYVIEHRAFTDAFRAVGYFRTHFGFQEQRAGDGAEVVILDAEGAGHLVGVGLSLQGKMDFGFLEGDERIYVDGNPVPVIHGTGLEDFFNGGWYFENGPFTLPLHGNTFQSTHNGAGRIAAYRFLLSDATPFTTRLRVSIEHGHANDADVEVWALAYYYSSVRP